MCLTCFHFEYTVLLDFLLLLLLLFAPCILLTTHPCTGLSKEAIAFQDVIKKMQIIYIWWKAELFGYSELLQRCQINSGWCSAMFHTASPSGFYSLMLPKWDLIWQQHKWWNIKWATSLCGLKSNTHLTFFKLRPLSDQQCDRIELGSCCIGVDSVGQHSSQLRACRSLHRHSQQPTGDQQTTAAMMTAEGQRGFRPIKYLWRNHETGWTHTLACRP